MARRARNTDPALAELQSELVEKLPASPLIPPRDEKRRSPRTSSTREATLAISEVVVDGLVVDVGSGGVFFGTQVLVETGERGTLYLKGGAPEGVPVRVVWLRGASHGHDPGMGLAFELKDRAAERRAMELLLAVLDEGQQP